MLRARIQRTLNPANTGTQLTVTHGLGVTIDAWWVVPISNRARQRTSRTAAVAPTAQTITVVNWAQTNATVDIFCLAYQGRLY